jgi:hypothetical protein
VSQDRRATIAFCVGLMASITAVPYILAVTAFHSNSFAPFYAAVVAFLGAGSASYVVVKKSQFSTDDAIKFFLLSDFFAVIAFTVLFVLIAFFELMFSDDVPSFPLNTGTSSVWSLPVGAIGMFVFALTVGDWITRGVGFIMAVPPVLLLLAFDGRLSKSSAD